MLFRSAGALDFSDTPEEVERGLDRKVAARPAALWLKIAGNLYVLVGAANVLRIAYGLVTGRLPFGFIPILVALAVGPFAVSFGFYLVKSARTLGQTRSGADSATTTAVLTLVAGSVSLLLAAITLFSAMAALILIAGGASFADPLIVPTALLFGLLYLAVGVCSLIAGIKTFATPRRGR